ncbi:hypothetical protein HOLleu_44520 [Holothuria leucospilota]|uniref:Uncharacterized protein n=1 Tax=Holothuria leucospilota TaxID=206669 RepID=A0A9Q0Y8T7_HOLLE|nr:hypothetical protein HOLleu_44520 [Holothuria leucospilota]
MKHQIDIWHASKSLLKKLSAAGKKKGCEVILMWMASIRNHFWYASRACEGDTLKLKETWSKVGQHVVNKHTWLDIEGYTNGGCSHGPLPEEHSKPWIKPNSSAHYELLGIIFDKKLMKDMHYYRNFRHTSYLESFHNHILMYASKRYSFGYDGYRTRNYLAAIDFNHHRDRANVRDADGNIKLQAKYSKASKQWHPVPVKEPKDYSYIQDLMGRIVSARVANPCHLATKPPVPADHPRNIRPHATVVPKPPMEELRTTYRSRFEGVPE